MLEAKTVETTADALWVLVKIKDSICALNSAKVESILLLEEDIIRLPGSNDIHLGIIRYRGGVLPIIDLRRMMGMIPHLVEQNEFEQMLEQRKQDHINWVAELERCVHCGDPFKLATDPHQCAFGKWYDHYKPTSQAIAFQLKKIDEPHRKLHETAHKALEYEKISDPAEREKYIQQVIQEEAKQYMRLVVDYLEETKKIFRSDHHRMVIVLADQNGSAGIMVDEVLSVENLVPVSKGDHEELLGVQSYVSQIAQRKTGASLVLVLDSDKLLEPTDPSELNALS